MTTNYVCGRLGGEEGRGKDPWTLKSEFLVPQFDWKGNFKQISN